MNQDISGAAATISCACNRTPPFTDGGFAAGLRVLQRSIESAQNIGNQLLIFIFLQCFYAEMKEGLVLKYHA